MRESIVTGIDIGTTKICAVIAELEVSGELNILGVGTVPSHGLKRGVVVNLEKTISSISNAVEEAERMAGVNINGAYVGIGGNHIRSMNSDAVIAVSKSESKRGLRHGEISEDDIERVTEAAMAVLTGLDREILHVLPQEYAVDDQYGIKSPIGITGMKLESKVHIVTCSATSSKNIVKAVNRSDITVNNLVLEPLASSYAVLDDEEKELGVTLIDFGGGTTDVALFFNGAVRHTAVVGLGSENITNDISYMLRTPREQAEEIKCEYGCAKQSLVSKDEYLKLKSIGGRSPREISRMLLASYIEPRVEEIMKMAKMEMKKCERYDMFAGGVVLTGGGAKLDGLVDLAQDIFNQPVKIGKPSPFKGLTDLVSEPEFATVIGLLNYAVSPEGESESYLPNEKPAFKRVMGNIITKITDFFV
ncbi:cell division protein FtsA [Candidatus Marinimicrobia bacterium MT.SAG.4]|nr:cell division protein FtsA [Candidatus Marinimicrobia bacterium MT.SAG.4]